ncbi:hypothetical protein HanRHA438_Chr16g0758201 [Helianthus annuus]|nr:putative stem-specific protein TSJT1 [Helianthus annuus]KAJ0835687.1 hypothetical protein HanRHA438_Chr16g0758201 [Helianthus annuus]
MFRVSGIPVGLGLCLPYVANYAHTLYCSVDDVHCIFLGSLNNVCALNKQYGLAKGTNESMFVIQAYKTLRDRSPFGYLDHTGGELMNFEHPKNKMKAITRVDSEGAVCGAAFKVDLFAKTKSMPRVGSHANWAWSQDA